MRARNIKPGLWLNEELAETSIPARYLFPALWCLADKEGRLEYRPKKIKAEVYPYDDVDIPELIAELHGKKFISVYSHESKLYIQIHNFKKHQNPHPKEKGSELPGCVSICTYNRNEKQFNYMESNLIIPDVLIPITSDTSDTSDPSDSLIQETLLSPDGDTHSRRITDCVPPYHELIEAYNKFCPSLSKATELTGNRRNAIRLRWTKYKDHSSGPLVVFDTLFKKAEASDFITGRDGRWQGKRGIDWLLNDANMVKVLEGNYDNKSNTRQSVSPGNMGLLERIKEAERMQG